MVGLSICGRDLLELRRESGGAGNTGGMLVRSGRLDWNWEELERVPGGDRGREEGKNIKELDSKVCEHGGKGFTLKMTESPFAQYCGYYHSNG